MTLKMSFVHVPKMRVTIYQNMDMTMYQRWVWPCTTDGFDCEPRMGVTVYQGWVWLCTKDTNDCVPKMDGTLYQRWVWLCSKDKCIVYQRWQRQCTKDEPDSLANKGVYHVPNAEVNVYQSLLWLYIQDWSSNKHKSKVIKRIAFIKMNYM